MDKVSVTRSAPSPTRTIVADEAFCSQAAAVLLCDEEPITKAFIGDGPLGPLPRERRGF